MKKRGGKNIRSTYYNRYTSPLVLPCYFRVQKRRKYKYSTTLEWKGGLGRRMHARTHTNLQNLYYLSSLLALNKTNDVYNDVPVALERSSQERRAGRNCVFPQQTTPASINKPNGEAYQILILYLYNCRTQNESKHTFQASTELAATLMRLLPRGLNSRAALRYPAAPQRGMQFVCRRPCGACTARLRLAL